MTTGEVRNTVNLIYSQFVQKICNKERKRGGDLVVWRRMSFTSKEMCIDFKLAGRLILISHATVCVASCVPNKHSATWTILSRFGTKRGTVDSEENYLSILQRSDINVLKNAVCSLIEH
jgi:hypothetical protein